MVSSLVFSFLFTVASVIILLEVSNSESPPDDVEIITNIKTSSKEVEKKISSSKAEIEILTEINDTDSREDYSVSLLVDDLQDDNSTFIDKKESLENFSVWKPDKGSQEDNAASKFIEINLGTNSTASIVIKEDDLIDWDDENYEGNSTPNPIDH